MWRGAFLLLLVLPATAQTELPLAEPGFERGYGPASGPADRKVSGEVARGWSDNSSWADVRVEYGRETRNPHRGSACQRITVAAVSSGAVQFSQQRSLARGRAYQFGLWLRGRPGAAVTVQIRLVGAPYTSFAEQTTELSAAWQPVELTAVMPADAEVYLMVRIESPMVVWLDDARLTDVTNRVSAEPPAAGNLMPNGSFEAGWSSGWSIRYPYVRGDLAGVDAGQAAVGRRSMRCWMAPGQLVRIASPLVPVRLNRAHVASVWLRASHPDVRVELELAETPAKQAVTAGPQWQRVALTGNVGFNRHTRLHLAVRNTAPQPRVFWFDGVMLEEAGEPSASYQGAAPVELVLATRRTGNIAFGDEPVQVEVGTAGDLPAGARLQTVVLDTWGHRRELPPVVLPATIMPLPLDPERPHGVFRLVGTVTDASGRPVSSAVTLTFARLPSPRTVPAESSFYGLHVPLEPRYLELARAVGATWVRLHDVSVVGKWAVAEPERDRWEFHDQDINDARAAGLAVLGMLDGAPGWIATKPRPEYYWSWFNIPDRPDGTERWSNYVRTVVSHYRGRIDQWEVWNEPWGRWYLEAGGTPERFAELMKAAWREAKAANPSALVVGVDTYAGQDDRWTRPVLAAAGTACYDVFSFHDYSDELYGGPQPKPSAYVAHYRDLQQVVGAARPQWNTEGGGLDLGSLALPEAGGMSAARQVAWSVRYQVTYLAAGVSRFFAYAVHADPLMGTRQFMLTEWDLTPKPALAARAVLAWLVDGAGRPERAEPTAGVDAYRFAPVAGRQVTVVWSYDGEPHNLAVPANTTVLDVYGNPRRVSAQATVTAEPLYLVCPSP